MSPPTARVDRRSPHPRLCASSARRVLGARRHHEKVAGFVLRRPAPCRSSSPRPRPTRTAIRMAEHANAGGLTLQGASGLTLQGASGLTLQGASGPRCKVLRDYAARRARRTQAARCLVTTLEGAARLCCRVLRDFAVEGLQASLKGRFATSLVEGLPASLQGAPSTLKRLSLSALWSAVHTQHPEALFTPSTLKRFSHPAP